MYYSLLNFIDPDYLKFLESLEETEATDGPPPVEVLLEEIEAKERELKANHGLPKVSTPLIDYISKKKEEKKNAIIVRVGQVGCVWKVQNIYFVIWSFQIIRNNYILENGCRKQEKTERKKKLKEGNSGKMREERGGIEKGNKKGTDIVRGKGKGNEKKERERDSKKEDSSGHTIKVPYYLLILSLLWWII